ncbi:MAG: CopG family transcriptional regulator [Clostridiales bacterium]|nr:CopG family transcriptional regulator [Clostridiales bacterium]
MTISVRLSKEDGDLIKKYAQVMGINVSELIRRTMLEHIEDEIDLRAYENAMEEYSRDKRTYSLDEVEQELNLT